VRERSHAATAGVARRVTAPLLLRFADFLSIEASFVLFVFAGRYKALPELRNFPIDFTILFLIFTWSLIVWALISGRLKPLPLDLPNLLIVSFCALATVSVFWSSLDVRNVDKTLRFLLLTNTGFFAAQILAQDACRRERMLRLLMWFSCAILLYYFYYRYVIGTDVADPNATGRLPADANNYQEYSAHANILFTIFLSLGVLGYRGGHLILAIVGCGLALFALLTIGGRGSLAQALIAIPFLTLILLMRPQRILERLARLSVLLCALAAAAVIGYSVFVKLQGGDTVAQELYTLERFEMQLSGEHTDSMDERLEAQEFAFRQWQQRPLFGWGMGEFRIQNSYLEYPHNLLLEILMEMGLVGGFLFFSACAIATIDCVRTAAHQAMNSGWVEMVIALLFLTELVSHLTVQGYLADDRELLTYLGMAIGARWTVRGRDARFLHEPILRDARRPQEAWRLLERASNFLSV
jgi:O-antigen ligase